MPWLHLSPLSPTPATTATPAQYLLIPTSTITTGRARAPAMPAALAIPAATETRAAPRELEPLWWEPRGADYSDMRSEAARSGHWEARWRVRLAQMRWRRDMSGRFIIFFLPLLWLSSRPMRSAHLRRFILKLLPAHLARSISLLITHENRHKHSRRASSSDNRRDREDSPGGLRGAISGFLHPHGGDERRSRSSYGERRRKDRGGSVSEDEEISIRRGGERWR